MKKLVILLAVAMITASTAGCAHRLRDWFYRGSACSPTATPVMMPQQYAAPTCCPPCAVDSGCDTCPGQVTYGPVMSDGSGAMVVPAPQTYVAPSPE